MLGIAAILLAANITLPTHVLVLRGGDRIETSGNVSEQNGQIVFRGLDGALYSLPANEVDLTASRALTIEAVKAAEPARAITAAEATKPTAVELARRRPLRRRLTDEERSRLLRELEANHGGSPAPQQQSLQPTPAPTKQEVKEQTQEEWAWRKQAREHEESLRQAKENRDLLVARAEQLRNEIAGLLATGYKPSQFSYQTSQLEMVKEQIPYANLEVTRADRAYSQFREDARKQGILPGWLR